MRDQIVRVKRFEKVPLILVGNKVDLESEREVSRSDGRALAQEWGCPFIETSAKSKTMVDELFAEIVRQMNYSTLPEKQEQCCTACVVQWRWGASISLYICYFLCCFFPFAPYKELSTPQFLPVKKKKKQWQNVTVVFVNRVHQLRRNVTLKRLCGVFSTV